MPVNIPSGDVMVEDSGVPVQDDWSMAPDEERVKFSLSGVTPFYKTMTAAVREELTAPHDPPNTNTKTCSNSQIQISDTKMFFLYDSVSHTHTNLLLVHSQFVATGIRFTAGLLILLFGKHGGILGK